MPDERKLISAAEFKVLARKGIKAVDLGEYAVFKGVAGRQKQIDRVNRVVPFILSNVRMDREGDTIQVGGWGLADYANNPVVLWAHSHDMLPVGKAIRTYIDGKNLRADDQFVGPELFPFADTVYRMIDGGFLNACSVGFQPSEWELTDTGVNFIKQDLLEHSVCPVPAHPEALVQARSKGIDTQPLRDWAERTLDLLGSTKRVSAAIKADLERLRHQADPEGREMVAVLREVVAEPADPAIADDADAGLDIDCDACAGKAEVDGVPCKACGGTGFKDTAAGTTVRPEVVGEAPEPVETRTVKGDPPATCEPVDGECPEGYTLGEGGMCHVDAEAGGRETSAGSMTTKHVAAPVVALPEAERVLTRAQQQAVLETALASATPERWNKRLSKRFDVATVDFPAGSAEEALVAAHLGVSLKAIERRDQSVPSVRMGAWLTAIDDVMREWALVDVRNIDYRGQEQPPAWEVIQLNSTLSNDFMVDGMRFVEQLAKDDQPERRATIRVTPEWYGMSVRTYGVHDTGEASKLLAEVAQKAKAINFLRGEAFSLSGEFMERIGETLEDLVLDPKNQAAVGRIVRLINERGGRIENRGAMLMGAPGTGKTLSARIVRNETKATFISVSARDFHYAGSFGGFAQAFEIARECAADGGVPSVIVFDDIDNYLNGYTVDLLKSEMDGVGQTRGVVTLMMTNFPELMPEALIDRPGRFHDVLRYHLPDAEARTVMLQRWMPDLPEEDAKAAAAATDGYSGAHIRHLARFAEIIAEQEDLTLPAALKAALVNLAEQRETITQAQTAGNRYRMPTACVRKGFGSTRSESAIPTPGRTAASGLSGDGTQSQIGTSGEKAGRVLSQKNESDLRGAKDALGRVLASVDGKAAKRGRALSAANEDRIRRADALLDEVLTQLAEAPEEPAEGVEGGGELVVLTLLEEVPLPVPVPEPAGVLVLAGDFEPRAAIGEAVSEAFEEQWMRLTGRVDLDG